MYTYISIKILENLEKNTNKSFFIYKPKLIDHFYKTTEK